MKIVSVPGFRNIESCDSVLAKGRGYGSKGEGRDCKGAWHALADLWSPSQIRKAVPGTFTEQSRGLVRWAKATETQQLFYYVPWQTKVHPKLMRFAASEGVGIRVVVVK